MTRCGSPPQHQFAAHERDVERAAGGELGEAT